MAKSPDWSENEFSAAPRSGLRAKPAASGTGSGNGSGSRGDEPAAADFDDYDYYAEAAAAYWSSRSGSDDGLLTPFKGDDLSTRVVATRRALSDALAAYWADGVPPALSVLRDGLLMLNAGHELDDSYRALLLRAALYRRHGILTALMHQVDAERTAVIVHDAVVNPTRPLPPAELDRIVHEDVTYDIWEAYLHGELLTTARQYDPARRVLAEVALSVLDGQPLYPVLSANFYFDANSDDELTGSFGGPRLLRLASLLVALALVIMALTFWQMERRRIDNMISMSAGVYTLIDANNATHTADLAAYFIDSMEVTNDQYRRCVARGKCAQPGSVSSLTHAAYYDDPAFGRYPVVHVDWRAARDYCVWRRKRLPSADEWQVAAGFAPATRRIHSYPWGDLYAVGLANDANAAAGDLLAGGQYRPAGDSLMGLSDMAGNAAEWTATPDAEDPSAFWVKGGSFQDGPEQIRASDGFTLPEQEHTAAVGFRCAATPLAAAIRDPGLLNWRGQ